MNNKERKKLQNKFAKENILFYLDLLKRNFNEDYSQQYINEIIKLSTGFNIRLTREQKLQFCKKCKIVWNVNLKNVKIRLNPKTRTKQYICQNCGFKRNFKY